jgi:polysaccharide deacetylase family protein (PEP-CTERM system associated)
MTQHGIINAMSVDVEDYFQVSAFEPYVPREDWPRRAPRVEANVDRILSLFDEHEVKGTFFTLGWVAERFPGMVRRIVSEGHELASHGWSHVRVTQQNPREFREDVTRTKKTLEDLSGQGILGYRAASYSVGRDNLWALDVLRETGHKYSSSIFPIKHDLYGMPEAPRFAYHPGEGGFVEFPMTTVRIAQRNFPCAGGGWFRLVPYPGMRWAMRRVNRRDKQPVIFYFHPWEIDPGQPRIAGLDAKTSFRHYLNLRRTERRLQRLLKDFRWGRMADLLSRVETGSDPAPVVSLEGI